MKKTYSLQLRTLNQKWVMKVNKVPFTSFVEDSTRKYTKIKQSLYLQEGLYPIIDQGQNYIAGYTNDKTKVTDLSKPVIAFGDHTKTFKYIDFPFAIGADGVKVLEVDREKADTKYVFEALKTINLPDVGYSRHFKYLKEKKIPLPEDLNNQKRIAKVLSKAEELIQHRKQTIALLDEYLKSVFLDMYAKKQDNSWFSAPLEKLKSGGNETFSNGPFGSDLLTSELTDRGVPVVYIRDIKSGRLKWESDVYVTEEKAASLKNCQVEENDILFAKVGDPPGTAAIYKNNYLKAIITQDVIRLRVNTKILTSQYLSYFFNSPIGKQLVSTISIKGTRDRFSLTNFKKLMVPVPPKTLQDKFAAIVEKAETIKQQYEQSLQKLEELYGSLSQRAFKGELDVSRVEIEEEEVPPGSWMSRAMSNNDDIEEAVKGSIEQEVVAPDPLPTYKKVQDMTLDEYYGVPDEIVEQYGELHGREVDWGYLLIRHFSDKPIDINEAEELFNKDYYDAGLSFNYQELKDFIFEELKKEDPIILQRYNKEKKQVELIINETKKVKTT